MMYPFKIAPKADDDTFVVVPNRTDRRKVGVYGYGRLAKFVQLSPKAAPVPGARDRMAEYRLRPRDLRRIARRADRLAAVIEGEATQ